MKTDSDMLPDASDSLEFALDAADHNPELRDPARALLLEQARLTAAQARLTSWQIRSERTALTFKMLTVLAGLAVVVALGIFLWNAASSRALVVEAFDTPPSMVQRGLTPQVVAGQLQDALAVIQATNSEAANDRDVGNAWTGDIKVQVPTIGISLGEFDRLVRSNLGHETHVGGAIVNNGDNTVSLLVRGTGIAPAVFTGPPDMLPKLVKDAADHVYGQFDAPLYAIYVLRHRGPAETIKFIETALPRIQDGERPSLKTTLGMAYSMVGRSKEAVESLREAVDLYPYNWAAWSNLLGDVLEVEGEQAAFELGLELRRNIAAAPSDRGVRPGTLPPLSVFYQLQQDWTSDADGVRRALAASGDEISPSMGTRVSSSPTHFRGNMLTSMPNGCQRC